MQTSFIVVSLSNVPGLESVNDAIVAGVVLDSFCSLYGTSIVDYVRFYASKD